MKTNFLRILKNLLFSVLMGIVSCQSIPYQPYARDVKRKPQQGGIIALKTEHREEDRNKAQNLMSSNCGADNVKVIEEGEVVIGEKTNASSDQSYNQGESPKQVGSLFGLPLVSSKDPSTRTSTETSTTQVKEWQISYECAKAEMNGVKSKQKAQNQSENLKNQKVTN